MWSRQVAWRARGHEASKSSAPSPIGLCTLVYTLPPLRLPAFPSSTPDANAFGLFPLLSIIPFPVGPRYLQPSQRCGRRRVSVPATPRQLLHRHHGEACMNLCPGACRGPLTSDLAIQVHADASNFQEGITKEQAYEQVLLQAEGLFDGQRNWVSRMLPSPAWIVPHVVGCLLTRPPPRFGKMSRPSSPWAPMPPPAHVFLTRPKAT